MMGHNVVFQSIVGFIAAGSLSYYGFGKWFVRWSLSKKIFQGKPLLYVWAFFVVFGLSCVVVNQIILSLILYGIWNDIADNCGYDEKSSFRYVGFCGIMLCTILGGAMIPYQSWMLGLANTWSDVTGSQLNMGLMGAMTIPATVLILTVYVFVSKWVFKVDYSTMQKFDVNKMDEESKHLRPRTKRILVVYLLTVFLCILGNTLIGTALPTLSTTPSPWPACTASAPPSCWYCPAARATACPPLSLKRSKTPPLAGKSFLCAR